MLYILTDSSIVIAVGHLRKQKIQHSPPKKLQVKIETFMRFCPYALIISKLRRMSCLKILMQYPCNTHAPYHIDIQHTNTKAHEYRGKMQKIDILLTQSTYDKVMIWK